METVNQSLVANRAFWAVLTVIGIYTLSIILSHSEILLVNPQVYVGITYDLTLLAPLLYLFIIWPSRVPRMTVVPVFIVGVLIASSTLPENQQGHLELIQQIVLPLVELAVIVIVFINVRNTLREIKLNKKTDSDLYSVLKKSAGKVLDNPKLGKIFATEIAMIYFGLFHWRKKTPGSSQFTGYKENGIVAIFYTLVFLVITETFVVHILLVKWQATIAWFVFGLSLYAGIQLLGHTKALRARFTELKKDKLILRYGLFGDAEIPIENILTITPFSDDLKGKTVKQLKMLGGIESHNLLIELKAPIPVESIYGTRKMADKVLLHLDKHQDFLKQFDEKQVNDGE